LRFILPLLFLCCVFSHVTNAQRFDNRAWLYFSHTNKLFSKFSLFSEAQLRMAEQLKYATATLWRGGIHYSFTKKHSAGIGYTYKGDREYNDTKGGYDYVNENRLYEQYQVEIKWGRTEFQTRARLEQRFVKEDGRRRFSQRGRLLLSVQIPISANTDFSRGWYTVLQNEIFVNVQHKEQVNNSVFDQNRLYASYGYRFNKQVDVEAGYFLWLQKADALEWRNVYQPRLKSGLALTGICTDNNRRLRCENRLLPSSFTKRCSSLRRVCNSVLPSFVSSWYCSYKRFSLM
jgi:hypothetical protein